MIKNLTKDLNRPFPKEGIPMTNRYIKMLNITNHQGNANQTTLRCHCTPVRTAIIQKSRDSKCWQNVEEGNPLHCWWEYKSVKPLQRPVRRFLRKLRMNYYMVQQFYC